MSGSEQRGLDGHDGQPIGADQQQTSLTRIGAEDAASDNQGGSGLGKKVVAGGMAGALLLGEDTRWGSIVPIRRTRSHQPLSA